MGATIPLARLQAEGRVRVRVAFENDRPDPTGYWYVRFTRGLDGTDLEIATSPIWIE